MKRHLLSLCAAASALLAFAPLAAHAAEGDGKLQVVDRVNGPDGGWDYASYDPARGRVYVTHGTVVLALDLASGKLNDNFAPGARLHEVVVVPGKNLLVTTNSGDSTAKLLKRLRRIVDQGAQGRRRRRRRLGAYDPATGLVVVINGDAGRR